MPTAPPARPPSTNPLQIFVPSQNLTFLLPQNLASEWALAIIRGSSASSLHDITYVLPTHTISFVVALSLLWWGHSQSALVGEAAKDKLHRRKDTSSPMYLLNQEFKSHYAPLKD
ncbi:hypothetical protein BASA81_003083 [Batrachochytrium salamandrivorans]|nr:hypothetical protein BASA81_003083 [Batrachochytrium salamandrivorans]